MGQEAGASLTKISLTFDMGEYIITQNIAEYGRLGTL
jgi:hypothetical protein